jgi:Glutaredoxin-like domain (DUF836)
MALKKSVTGTVYTADDDAAQEDNAMKITICLFTKPDCTLCDKVKDVLYSIRTTHAHSLHQIDITDDRTVDADDEHDGSANDTDTWWSKYKYDIPVLHLNGQYWCKHKLSMEQAQRDMEAYRAGTWTSPLQDEPNAGAMERRRSRSK